MGQITCNDGAVHNVALLRDSGAQQSLLSKEKVSDTGEFRLIQGIGGSVLKVPLIEVTLSTKLGNGFYLFGLTDCLSDSFFDGILGNDLDPPEENIISISVSVVTRSKTAVSQNQASSINKDNLTNLQTKSSQINLTTTSNKGDKQVRHKQQNQTKTTPTSDRNKKIVSIPREIKIPTDKTYHCSQLPTHKSWSSYKQMITHLRHCTNLLIKTKQIRIHKFVSFLTIMF